MVFDLSRTLLIGSIFYSRHSIVFDPHKGEFDREKAEDLINRQEELSEEYRIPSTLTLLPKVEKSFCVFTAFSST